MTKPKKHPKHVAIIMDGNGRWAARRHLPRFRGHLEGVNRVEEIIDAAQRTGIQVLTLYVFSTENWRRPTQEVSMLMSTLCRVLEQKLKKLVKGNIRLKMIGFRDGVPAEVLRSMDRVAQATQKNTGMVLALAFNYGARQEILQAVNQIAKAVQKGDIALADISDEMFSRHLLTADLPDPDLLIRTSGEMRVSNFLLWQTSYAELYFTEKYWPDFDEKEFQKALADFQRRERRFGKIKPSEEETGS